MPTRSESPLRRETLAPDITADRRLDMYRESWDMLEASAPAPTPRGKYTLAGCLPDESRTDTRMNLYQESLDMLEEIAVESQQQNLQAMGFFVHTVLLRELDKLERYRQSAGINA